MKKRHTLRHAFEDPQRHFADWARTVLSLLASSVNNLTATEKCTVHRYNGERARVSYHIECLTCLSQ